MTVEIVSDYKDKKYTCKGMASLRNFKQKSAIDISVGRCEDGSITWWYDNPWSRSECHPENK